TFYNLPLAVDYPNKTYVAVKLDNFVAKVALHMCIYGNCSWEYKTLQFRSLSLTSVSNPCFHGMAVFDMSRIVQSNELINICVCEVFCRIPCKHSLAVGAIDLLERQ